MGRGSVRQNKNKFQLIREDLGLSREKAAELLETVSPERIEKIESGKCAPYPEEVLAFARKYKRPSLCNYYCSQCCPIGKAYVPEVEMKELSAIVLEMLASLEITADGKVSGDEIDDFITIQQELERISVTVETLQLWSEKMLLSGAIDRDAYEARRKQG